MNYSDGHTGLMRAVPSQLKVDLLKNLPLRLPMVASYHIGKWTHMYIDLHYPFSLSAVGLDRVFVIISQCSFRERDSTAQLKQSEILTDNLNRPITLH